MERITAVYNTLEALDESEVIDCWNEYADSNRYEIVFPMYEFEDLYSMEGKTPFDVKRDLEDVDELDKYVYDHDVYGWQSFNHYWDDNSPVSISDMARYSVKNEDDLGNSSIREIFDLCTVKECLSDYDNEYLVEIDGTRMTVGDWWLSSCDVLNQLVDMTKEKEDCIEFILI